MIKDRTRVYGVIVVFIMQGNDLEGGIVQVCETTGDDKNIEVSHATNMNYIKISISTIEFRGQNI